MGSKQHTLRYLGSSDQFVDGEIVFEAGGDPVDVDEDTFKRVTGLPGEMWEELVPEQVEDLAKAKKEAENRVRQSTVIPVKKQAEVIA